MKRLLAAVAMLTLLACSPVPPAPADLMQVVDPGPDPRRGAEVARELLHAGDLAWADREDPSRAAAARDAYGRAAYADPALYDGYWKAARAAAWIGDRTEGKGARAAEFERGAGIARLGIAVDPTRAEAHYYYAVTLGLLARERETIGLASIQEMLPQLEAAGEADPSLDDAGPYRTLALIYLRAPAWPTSVGDDELGLEWAERAVAQDPEDPANQLALGEALLANRRRDDARRALDRAAERLAAGEFLPSERERMQQELDRLMRKLR